MNLIKIRPSHFHSSLTEPKRRNLCLKKTSHCLFNHKILGVKDSKSDYFKMNCAADDTQKHNFRPERKGMLSIFLKVQTSV